MSSENFYHDLPAKPLHTGLFDQAHHYTLPDDWMLVIADVIGSTAAVAQGRYKDVNVLSSCAIIAVLNRVGRGQIAYIYGGDGATFVIPRSLAFDVASALYGVQRTARDVYKLDLRAAMVGVDELQRGGFDVRIAKLESTPGMFQTAISGNGVMIAEQWVKDAARREYKIDSLFDPLALAATPPNFDGFECRWKPLDSRNGVTVSLILISRLKDQAREIEVYEAIVQKIIETCGPEDKWRPVSAAQLVISADPRDYRQEVAAVMQGRSILAKSIYWFKTTLVTWAARACVRFGWKMGAFNGETYIEETLAHGDYLKFENALKLVMDISAENLIVLGDYFDRLRDQGIIFYGIHAAPAAMMTRLVFDHNNDHFHFIDGADGGYTMAAQALKAQIKDARLQVAA